MLPAAARLTDSRDFQTVVRRGRRAGRPRLVVHALISRTDSTAAESAVVSAVSAREQASSSPTQAGEFTARVGFVVSKAVGNSVVRHRVSRRLRHLMRDRLGTLPAGCSLVVRALPASSASSSADLGADLDGALRRLGLASTDRGGAA